MIIFTSICTNYTHKARCLAKSVHQWIPDAKFFVCLTEREIPSGIQKDECFDCVVLSKDMWEGNFERFIFKHSIVEASTAVKGRFFQYLMSTYPDEDAYIYLDPDCFVYSDFIELKEILKEKPIILCPHLLHPGNVDMELSSTAHGVYNLGFLAVNHSTESTRFIDWWADRLYMYCYDDIEHGIFTDQKWIDLAPCFFDVEILKHYGYDFAPWGLLGARIKASPNGYTVQDMPLRFIHFSGFGSVAERCMEQWLGEDAVLFRQIYADYAKEHEINDKDNISKSIWSYENYESGEIIKRSIREAYRKDWDLMFSLENPFSKSNQFFEDYWAGKGKKKISQEGRIVRLSRATVRTYRENGFSGVVLRMIEKIKNRIK